MSTGSRASSDDDDAYRGAGGKLVRRHRRQRPTPYQRPDGGNRRGWLSGLVSGAGRLLSTVLRPRGEDVDSSESEEESSEDNGGIRNNRDVNQGEEGSVPAKSSNKLLIEQLIQKECFTRSESDRLIEIIQSRAIDSPLFRGTVYPGSLMDQVRTPEFCDKAVMEARKWVEEKRSEIKSKAAQNSGTSTLNADNENDKGSPVDMAKSYMQTLPPWISPTRISGFRTPSIKTCSEKLGSLHAPSSSGLSSLQELKIKYGSAGPFDDLNTTRSVRQKTGKNITVSPCSGHSQDEHPQTLDDEVLGPTPAINEPEVHISCSPEVVADHRNTINSSEDFSRLDLSHGGVLSTQPSEAKDRMDVDSQQQEILVSENNQDLEEIAPMKELTGNVSTEGVDVDLLHKDKKGLGEDFTNAEPISMILENDNPTAQGDAGKTVDVAESGNSHRLEGPGQEKFKRKDNSQFHSSAVPEVVDSDARPHVDLVDEEMIEHASATVVEGVHSIPSRLSAGKKPITNPGMVAQATANNVAAGNVGKLRENGSPRASRRRSLPTRQMPPRKATLKSATGRGRKIGRGSGK